MSRRLSLPNPSEVVAAPGPTPSGLIEGRVPYAGPNGRLVDNEYFTYEDGTLMLQAAVVSLYLGAYALGLTQIISRYKNIDTEGLGLPAIFDDVALTGQVANIASTNFTNGNVAGTYRLGYYLVCTAAAVGAGSITFSASFNDGVAVRTLTGTALALTTTGYVNSFQIASTGLIRLGSGSISYSVAVTGIYSTAVYALYATLERLS